MPKTYWLAALVVMPMAAQAQTLALRGEVKTISARPPPSGVVASWVEVVVSTKAGRVRFLIPYGGDDQKLPAVGKSCDFRYTLKDISGFVGVEVRRERSALVADDFACEK